MALLVGGFAVAVVAPTVEEQGLCAFVPCDAKVQMLGWSKGPNGRAILEVGPVSARETTTVELDTADDADGASKVLWRITRAPGNSPAWDGMVTPGDTPAGFTQAVRLTVPVPAAAQARTSNGCYYGLTAVPRALPARGIVAWGDVMTRQDFAKDDFGYSSCPGNGPRTNGWGWVVMAVGAVLLGWRAWSVRRRPQAA